MSLPIRPELIFVDLPPSDPESLLAELARRIEAAGGVPSAAALAKSLIERENLGSTAVGGGVAIPHAKVVGLRRPLLAVGVCRAGVDFAAPDGDPVRLLFVIASPPDAPAEHLRTLAAVSRWLSRGAGRVEGLLEAGSPEAVAGLLEEPAA